MGEGEMQHADLNPMAWASDTLLRQGMPSYEIRSMLGADDFETVRRYLELHRERLAERLNDELRAVDRVERLLAGILDRPPAIRRTRVVSPTRATDAGSTERSAPFASGCGLKCLAPRL
jgi:hypothetical protein